MTKQSAKIFVPRAFVLCRMDLNLPRQEMQQGSEDSARIGRFMASQQVRPGEDIFGWHSEKAVAGLRASDATTETLLPQAVPERRERLSNGDTVIHPPLTVDRAIEFEMQHRESRFAVHTKAAKDSVEYKVFAADFCDAEGNLIDLRKVPRDKIFILVEGHHRLMKSYELGHAEAAENGKQWTTDIPVLPSTFASQAELCMFQTRNNMADASVNRLTRFDMIKIAIGMFFTLNSGTAFRKFIGEAGVSGRRTTKGSEDDESDAEVAAKKDAGSIAAFCWAVAELHFTFPKLDVWGCLTADKKHKDYVPLTALSIQNKDWMASAPVILTITNRDRLETYIRKYTKNPTPKIVEVWNAVCEAEGNLNLKKTDYKVDHNALNYGGVMTEEWVEAWWNGRKPNANNGMVETALTPETDKGMDKAALDNMAVNPNLIVKQVGIAIKKGADSPDYAWLLDPHNFQPLNACYDIVRHTRFGLQLEAACKAVSLADAARKSGQIDPKTASMIDNELDQLFSNFRSGVEQLAVKAKPVDKSPAAIEENAETPKGKAKTHAK